MRFSRIILHYGVGLYPPWIHRYAERCATL